MQLPAFGTPERQLFRSFVRGGTSRNTARKCPGGKKEREEGRNADPIIILGEPRPVQAAYL